MAFLSSRLSKVQPSPTIFVTQKARVARTFHNIRLFRGMTVLENLLVAQHNRLMVASGFTLLGVLGSGPVNGVLLGADWSPAALARGAMLAPHLFMRGPDQAAMLLAGYELRSGVAAPIGRAAVAISPLLLSTLTFTEHEGRTTLTMTGLPHEATEAERKTFEAGLGSMQQGWAGTLDQLAGYLANA